MKGSRELVLLERLVSDLPPGVRAETLVTVDVRGTSVPVWAIDFGPELPAETPVVLYVGGVHGLESIGSEILMAHLTSLCEALAWDEHMADLLRRVRVVFIPIANPSGVAGRRRSNGSGVDLMRNAPVESVVRESPFLVFRGHRLGPLLPWYRGREGAPMEPEAQALTEFVERVVFPAPFAVSVDVHSGFFGKDRLWFPYAHTQKLLPNAAEMLALKDVLDRTYPNHRYVVEPQSAHYTTHGDLWDHLYDGYRSRGAGTYLPLTLELGSSSWLRKNPLGLFDRRAMFHPLDERRVTRVLRRHTHLLELFIRLALSRERWLPKDPALRWQLDGRARRLWDAHR